MNLKATSMILSGLMFVGSVNGAEGNQDKKDKKSKQQTAAKDAPKEIPSIEKFIKSDAEKHEGMFNIYKQNDRYYVEVPDNLLGRDIMVFVSIIRGAAQDRVSGDMMGFYAGDVVANKVIRFAKGPKDRLFILEPNYSQALPEDKKAEMYGAVHASNMQPIAEAFEVKAKGKNSVLVDFTDMYKSDHVYFSMKGMKEISKTGAYQADKSYPTTVSTFPENVIFRSVRSYAAGAVRKDRSGKQTKATPTTWEVASCWQLLPEKPMRPRYFDPRVGYFLVPQTDYVTDPVKAKVMGLVNRWRLEPKEEDMDKYAAGELVEPKKPIIFYLDKNTPKALQPYLLKAVEMWNPVFEQAGFKNAVIARLEPTKEEDPNYSPEDTRYSYISYKASTIPNAYGPQVNDPRSGEIICSHVGVFHNVQSLVRQWYFAQTAAVDPQAHVFPYSDELMGKLMSYVIGHEVGHTLGLRHNFRGSWTYDLKDIRNKDYVKEHSHGPSVMDYMRFNYAAQPEDNIAVEDLIPRIGDYDRFAIEWGYRYFPQFKTAKEEQEYLAKWVTEQRKKNPRVIFGTETDQWDPRLQSEDLSNDAIAANELGIKNLKRIASHLMEWTKDDEDYTYLKEMYQGINSQWWRFISHAMKFVGGRYSETSLRSEGSEKGYVPVAKEDQERAMKFIVDQALTEPEWLLRNEAVKCVGFDSDSYEHRMVKAVYGYLLKRGLGLSMHEANLGSENVYTMKDMTDDLYDAAFGRYADRKSLSFFERALQVEYVKAVMDYLKREAKPGEAPEMIGLLSAQLEKISADAKKAVSDDATTKNHRIGLAALIDAWVEGDQKMILK